VAHTNIDLTNLVDERITGIACTHPRRQLVGGTDYDVPIFAFNIARRDDRWGSENFAGQ